MPRKLMCLFSSLLLLPPAAIPWSAHGHQTVAEIALLFLKQSNPDAFKNLGTELGIESLADASTWMDDIKNVETTPSDPDTVVFLNAAANKKHKDWHFVNLPLNCTSYAACSQSPTDFSLNNDIVHMINEAVQVFKGSTAAQKSRFSKRVAIRILAHLIGDLHQPLHVGCGYIRKLSQQKFEFVRDPVLVKQKNLGHDRGGGRLLFGSNNLHSHWDGSLVNRLDQQILTDFAPTIKMKTPPQPSWTPQGAVLTWAGQFATDSMKLSASSAYKGVAPRKQQSQDFTIDLDKTYSTDRLPDVQVQLVKGGFRLALVLAEVLK